MQPNDLLQYIKKTILNNRNQPSQNHSSTNTLYSNEFQTFPIFKNLINNQQLSHLYSTPIFIFAHSFNKQWYQESTAFNLTFKLNKHWRFNRMKNTGHIQLIMGPMFSGKSSEMQRKVRRYQHARKNCLVINYMRDNRYSFQDVAATHDKITIKALKAGTIKQIREKALQHDVVAIDEGQFFPDIVEEAENLANSGKVVIIAALDGTFQRKPFGSILSLVPMAEYVTKLSAVCIDCGKQAAFTRRTIDCQEIELIGGQQTYKPVCRDCFGLTKSKQQNQKLPMQKKILVNSSQIETATTIEE